MDELKEIGTVFDKLLTPQEYADKYRIALRTVYDRITKGKLKMITFKGKNLVDTR